MVEVFLTAAGKRLQRKAAQIPACMLDKAELSLPELRALRAQLQALTARLRSLQDEEAP